MARIVCLCGSTRFKEDILIVSKQQTMLGNIVLAPNVFGHSGDPMTDEQKEMLDRLHLEKIDMSDAVIVVCPNDYIGESTSKEIAYAESSGKQIAYMRHTKVKSIEQAKGG